MTLRNLYLLLAIVGAIVPYVFFVQHIQAVGPGPLDFVAPLFANGAVGGFTADLLISSFVFWIAMFVEQRRDAAPAPALFIALNLCIGLSCALPAWLCARETRALTKRSLT